MLSKVLCEETLDFFLRDVAQFLRDVANFSQGLDFFLSIISILVLCQPYFLLKKQVFAEESGLFIAKKVEF